MKQDKKTKEKADNPEADSTKADNIEVDNAKADDPKAGRQSRLSLLIPILVFIVGLSLLLYPSVSNYWNSLHQSRTIASYVSAVEDLSDDMYDQILASAYEYNSRLYAGRIGLNLPESWQEDYQSQLNVAGDGVMGYIIIDKINCRLPIYHGTDDSVLNVAIGHIDGSSLPVGGESTHCVLSGHRGLPSAELFSRLDKLVEGDTFVIQTLDEILTYEVDKISIVLPNEMDELQTVEGEDLCTLVTCTPYGVNTHRLLVRGHRVANENKTTLRVTSEANQIEAIRIAPAFAAPLLLLLLLRLMFHNNRKKKRGKDL